MSCENVFKHGEKLKKCDQCDFTFSDAGILKHTVEKIQTSATSVTLHQSRLSLWGNIWKRIVEKSQTSATNMIFKKNPLWYLLTMRAFMSLNRNDCEQWEHTNGFSPVCLLLCTFRFESEPETSSHWSQGYGLSVFYVFDVAPSGGQICNYCKWCHVVDKFNPSHGVNFFVLKTGAH